MQLADFDFVRLSENTEMLPFCSEDDDLNSFLIDDAKNYSAALMSVTYMFIDRKREQTIAYFSILNDKVAYDPMSKGIWNRINRHIRNNKRRHSYPSAKIGRLAVAKEYSHCGLGTQILDLVKAFLITEQKLGCRFLTVDAYANAIRFYQKNGFDFFTTLDYLDKTRLMYFDLKPFKDQQISNI